MSFDPTWFGEHKAGHELLSQAPRQHIELAKDVILKELMHATCDHEGRHINERKWQWLIGVVEGI